MPEHSIIIELLVSGFGAISLVIFEGISRKIGRLTESVDRLNQNMAVIIQRVDNHEKRLDRLEEGTSG